MVSGLSLNISRLNIAVSVAIAVFFGGCFAAASQTASGEKPAVTSASLHVAGEKTKKTSAAHVYLFRGLMNIFSLGMDDLAQKIQNTGVYSTVHEYGSWKEVSNQIAAKYKAGDRGAIILIGHSLGADVVMMMGEYLGTLGVPVTLIVPFDATRSFAATSNVQRVMNITQRDYAYMSRGPGFHGELHNVDVSRYEGVGHITIDKAARLHSMVVSKVLSVARSGAGEIRTAAPAGEMPAGSSAAKNEPKQQEPAARKSQAISGTSTTVEIGLSNPVQPASHTPSFVSEPSVAGIPSPSGAGSSVSAPLNHPPSMAKESGSAASTARVPQRPAAAGAVSSASRAAKSSSPGTFEYQELR